MSASYLQEVTIVQYPVNQLVFVVSNVEHPAVRVIALPRSVITTSVSSSSSLCARPLRGPSRSNCRSAVPGQHNKRLVIIFILLFTVLRYLYHFCICMYALAPQKELPYCLRCLIKTIYLCCCNVSLIHCGNTLNLKGVCYFLWSDSGALCREIVITSFLRDFCNIAHMCRYLET